MNAGKVFGFIIVYIGLTFVPPFGLWSTIFLALVLIHIGLTLLNRNGSAK